MLWRVRTTLPDRPGALAVLAQGCGDAGVNILGLQIFPGVGAVTDELVLRTPAGWTPRAVSDLVEGSGGSRVQVSACTEAALTDQPTRFVHAARAVLADPMSFPEVVGRLLDVEATPAGAPAVGGRGLLEVTVGDLVVQVRRDPAFTATEHARAAALADLVSDVLRSTTPRGSGDTRPGARGAAAAPDYAVDGASVTADVGGVVVGLATVHPADDPARPPVTLRVDPAWRRRGIGTRLLLDVARLARALGAEEVVLTTTAGDQAVVAMVVAAGLRGRIRLSGDSLVVRVPVASLGPLRARDRR